MRVRNLEGTATMAKLSTDELLDTFKEMTLLELSEFVKQFEDTFGVTAAAPVAVAAAPGPVAAPPPRRRPSRTSSTSSSRPPARRRSTSSRRSARSPAWASRRPRSWSRPLPRRSWRRSTRRPPRRPRRASRVPARPSPSSDAAAPRLTGRSTRDRWRSSRDADRHRCRAPAGRVVRPPGRRCCLRGPDGRHRLGRRVLDSRSRSVHASRVSARSPPPGSLSPSG